MKVLSMVSQKGGSGRSCLSAHLSVAFEEVGVSTVVIDLDQQASISQWGETRVMEEPTVVTGHVDRLGGMLDTARQAGMALVIIDTPPHSERVAVEAVAAADLILMPIRPSIFDLRSLGDTVKLVTPKRRQDAIVVLNGVPPRGTISDEAEEFVKGYGVEIAPVRVGMRWSLSYALIDGRAITEFEPKGKAADEIRALRKLIANRLELKKKRRGKS